MKDARVARYIFAAKSLGVVRGIGRCGMRGQLSIARAMTGAMNVIACARNRGEWASGCADHGPSTSKASSTVRSPFSRRIQSNLTDSPVHSRARVNTPCTGPPSERVVSCYDVYSLFSLLRQDIGAGYPPIISEKCRIWEERKLRRRRRTSEIKDAFGPVLRTVFVPSNCLRAFEPSNLLLVPDSHAFTQLPMPFNRMLTGLSLRELVAWNPTSGLEVRLRSLPVLSLIYN